jgi:glutamate racemase
MRFPLLIVPVASLPSRHAANAQIGVFDSGVGGLTVLKEIHKQLPNESVLYFGDTARVPYGNREPAEIIQFVREILTMMSQRQVKMVLMACSTGSALALDLVRNEFDFPIVGVVKPGARAAVQAGKRVGVIATQATVNSQAYGHEMRRCKPNVQVWEIACPQFVPLIEQNLIHHPETLEIARDCLQPLLDIHVDTLVFGCTHYPHLQTVFEKIMPVGTKYINPAESAVRESLQVLEKAGLQNTSGIAGETSFYVSGCAQSFAHLSVNWLQQQPPVENISVAALQSYTAF